jgi:hypothetical protein
LLQQSESLSAELFDPHAAIRGLIVASDLLPLVHVARVEDVGPRPYPVFRQLSAGVHALTRADRLTTMSLTFFLECDRVGLMNLVGEINLKNQRCDVGVSGLGSH